jgi:hypothetical protein
MKKAKYVKPFYFKHKTHQQVLDEVNSQLPINLKYNGDIIDRIHTKYPLVEKSDISKIVIAVFQSMRDFMVLGKVLNFNNLFFDAKLHFFTHRRNGHILPALKAKISTPPLLRKK